MSDEGGFQGRTNKLVDGCYSWWQAGMFPILHAHAMKSSGTVMSKIEAMTNSWLRNTDNHPTTASQWLYDVNALQRYLLFAAQPEKGGGMCDKPGKDPDFYHTCYCLSGLSICQYQPFGGYGELLGGPDNALSPTHPVHNVSLSAAHKARQYFTQFELPNK
eukprot:c2415_g1_i1.p1 GENE.c2415_g1_i1~~c2415_g1_i1.p1  ORF type:complete len:161 (+),score=24.97 c2415_g1_i1:258-740(+)